MALQPQILEAINTPQHRVAIAAVMGCTEMSVIRYIGRNDMKLTQHAPLQKIMEIVGAADPSQVLQAVPA